MLLPGLANIPLLVLLFTPAVLVLSLICRKHTEFRLTSTCWQPAEPSCSCLQVFAGVCRCQVSACSPLSPLLFLVRSMWSFSWMRTCRSLGRSLMNGCLRSCSVLGRWLWLFTRQLSMNDWNFFDLDTQNTHTHTHTKHTTHTHNFYVKAAVHTSVCHQINAE